jgi:hypothetical protein
LFNNSLAFSGLNLKEAELIALGDGINDINELTTRILGQKIKDMEDI